MSINKDTEYTVMKNVIPKKYFYFEQTDVEGVLLFDKELKISANMVVKAKNEQEAKEKILAITDKIATPHLDYCDVLGERWVFVDAEFYSMNITNHIEVVRIEDEIFIHE